MFFPTLEQIATQNVITVAADTRISDAIALMQKHDLRDIVIDRGDRPTYGIFTVNDLANSYAGAAPKTLTLAEAGFSPLQCAQKSDNVLDVFSKLAWGEEYLGVLDEEGQLWGIVSFTDIVTSVDPQILIERQQIGDIFSKILVNTAPPTRPLGEVLNQLNNADDAVIIIDQGHPVGILTTKDAIRIFSSDANLEGPVSVEMSAPVETVSQRITIKQALELIRTRRYKRLVVEEKGSVLGVITQRELVSIAYNRWAGLLRNHSEQLHEVVGILEAKTEQLERMATTDTLTGLPNRGKLQQTLTQEIKRANRYKDNPFSVVLIDIDRFKQINDTCGHPVGDQVLKQLATLLSEQIRDTDFVARWGGEEFVLLLPMTLLTPAEQLADRLRQRVAETRFPVEWSVTFSAGVAQHHSGESMDALFQRVDKALYQAKLSGRNQISIAPNPEP